jgi:purine-binding chemotaxis protein CheW
MDVESGVFINKDTLKDRYLTFLLETDTYGIEVKYVTEIIGIQNVTEVPQFPEYVIGIINLRGNVIPVMDLRLRLKKEKREYNDRTCIIVAELSKLTIGIIVDSVSEVLTISEQDIVSPPQISMNSATDYLKGIGNVENGLILLLDCEALVSGNEI